VRVQRLRAHPDLDLKFVVHHGTILRQRIAGGEELLGSDVILVHRLLENEVLATTGIRAYALLSQACVDAMDVDVSALGMQPTSESYDHIGTVPVWVHDLERRWADEEARTRVLVDGSSAFKEISIRTTAPPQVAWEFVTAPGRRVLWQVGVAKVEVTATGNRRGVGATNHCLHGADVSVEELLDWRPCDYLTFRNNIPTPMGVIRLLETTEFEPTPDGTTIHWPWGAPKTAKERAVMHQMESFLDEAMSTSAALLTEHLDAELERHRLEVEEPELPSTRPDGPLAGLSPAS